MAHKLTQHGKLQANLLEHGWKEVHMHACEVSHTGIQPQSNMAVLQALQVDVADSMLASVHMHSICTTLTPATRFCTLMHSNQEKFKHLQICRGECAEQPPIGHNKTCTTTVRHLARVLGEQSITGTQVQPTDIQSNTQGITWQQRPLLAPHLPREASTALRPSIRVEWHPGWKPALLS